MELIIEEKKAQPISYEGILRNMNLKVVDGKLSQDEPIKKNVYFYPQENNKNIHSNYSTTKNIQPNYFAAKNPNYFAAKNNIAPQAQPPRQLITPKQQYIKYLVHKINQKKRISQIKSKKMYFV
jgi:hypothetical protein